MYTSKYCFDITNRIISVDKDVLRQSQVAKDSAPTYFVNAVVEADSRRLSKVAVVKLGGLSTRGIPLFSDYPQSLKSIMQGLVYYLDGGLGLMGERSYS